MAVLRYAHHRRMCWIVSESPVLLGEYGTGRIIGAAAVFGVLRFEPLP